MNLQNITIGDIVTAISILTALYVGLSSAFKPVKTFETRLEKLERRVDKDYENINAIQKDTNMILKTLRPILDHMSEDPNGNHKSELQQARENLNEYIIDRK